MSPRMATFARWALALIVVGILVSVVDLGAIGTRLAGTDLRLAVPAVSGLVLVHLIAATTWRRLLHELVGVSLGWAAAVRLYYAAQVLGTVTPGNLGADVYRVVSVDAGTSRARLAQPVLVQRLTSTLAIVCLGVAGAVVLPIHGLGAFAAAAAALGAILAMASVAVVRPGDRAGRIGQVVRRLWWQSGGSASSGRIRSALRDGLGLGLVFHATSLLLGLVLVRAVDPDAVAQPWLVLGALAVARLSLAVPLSPNGIGIQEGLLAILFVQLGLPADTAIAAALLNRVAFLATAAVGAVAFVSPGHPSPVPAVRPSRPPAAASRSGSLEGWPDRGC